MADGNSKAKGFPRRERLVRRQVHGPPTTLRLLRNRIAHHEPVFKRDLSEDHNLVLELAGWMSSAMRSWVEYHSRVPTLLAGPRKGKFALLLSVCPHPLGCTSSPKDVQQSKYCVTLETRPLPNISIYTNSTPSLPLSEPVHTCRLCTGRAGHSGTESTPQ